MSIGRRGWRRSYENYRLPAAQLIAKAQRRPLRQQEFDRLQQLLACMRMVCDTPGDGDAMRIAPEVRENGFGFAEWLLRIDTHSDCRNGARKAANALVSASAACAPKNWSRPASWAAINISARPGVGTTVTARGRPTRSWVYRRSTSCHPLTARRPVR